MSRNPSVSVQYKFRIVTDGPGEVQLETNFNPAAFSSFLSQNVSQGNAPPVDFSSDQSGSDRRYHQRNGFAKPHQKLQESSSQTADNQWDYGQSANPLNYNNFTADKPQTTPNYPHVSHNSSPNHHWDQRQNSIVPSAKLDLKSATLAQYANGIEADSTDMWLNRTNGSAAKSAKLEDKTTPIVQRNAAGLEADETDMWLNRSSTKTNGTDSGYHSWENPEMSQSGLYNTSLINNFQEELIANHKQFEANRQRPQPQVTFSNGTISKSSGNQLSSGSQLNSNRFHSQETVKLTEEEEEDNKDFPKLFQKRREVIDKMLKSRFDTKPVQNSSAKSVPKSTSFTQSTSSNSTPTQGGLTSRNSRIVSQTVTEHVDIQQTETVNKETTSMTTTLRKKSAVPTAL